MTGEQILYRTRQFLNAMGGRPDPRDYAHLQEVLKPAQMELFLGMQPGEQSHSLTIYRKLLEGGETHPDLLVAALLHDAGKSRMPLRLWERAWIVLGKTFLPGLARQWGEIPSSPDAARGWRRAFVVAEKHAMWGAEMAEQAGASKLAAALIRRHQEKVGTTPGTSAQGGSLEERLLVKLQSVDNES